VAAQSVDEGIENRASANAAIGSRSASAVETVGVAQSGVQAVGRRKA
jgi:hypothetical protein